MKKFIPFLLITILFTSCADSKTIDDKKYRPYGLFNQDQYKNDSIEYQISGWAVFSGIFFSEVLLIPTIYTFGYNLWEPIGKKNEFKDKSLKGVIN